MEKIMMEKLQDMVELKEENTLYYSVATDLLNMSSTDDDFISQIKDTLNYGCQSGVVSSQIYYSDTQKFFDKHQDEIFNLLNNYIKEFGSPSFEINSNNLSWLAYEETTRDIALDLGIEY